MFSKMGYLLGREGFTDAKLLKIAQNKESFENKVNVLCSRT